MDNSQLMTSTFMKTKFNWRSPSMDRGSVDKFTSANSSWSSGHMYRTSYRDMSVKDQAPLKAYAIAKYAGFIPGKDGNSELGRVYTKISRRCFDKEDKFQNTHKRFKSTGFNGDQQNFDNTRPSFFRGMEKKLCLDHTRSVSVETDSPTHAWMSSGAPLLEILSCIPRAEPR